MKRMIGIAVFGAMAGAAFAGEAFELNRIAGKDISQAAGEISVNVPEAAEPAPAALETVKTMSWEYVAAEELRKTLYYHGARAKVTVARTPGKELFLVVKFASRDDYELSKAYFYQDPVGTPSYRGVRVSAMVGETAVNVPEAAKADISRGVGISPMVPEDIAKTPNLWKQVSLKAADGTVITVDYTPMNAGMKKTIAEPVWVTVLSPGRGVEKARAVLINYYDNSDRIKETQTLDLAGVGSYTFKARAQSLAIWEMNAGQSYTFRQEIAVVVDGRWLVDPVTGGHNFKFNMAMAR